MGEQARVKRSASLDSLKLLNAACVKLMTDRRAEVDKEAFVPDLKKNVWRYAGFLKGLHYLFSHLIDGLRDVRSHPHTERGRGAA